MYEHGELFEAEDAKSLPEHNDEDKGGPWRKKASYYLTSKYPDMEQLSEWVECKQEVVDSKFLRTYNKIGSKYPTARATHLWGVLDTSLSGDAWETSGDVTKGASPEAWIKVLADVTHETRVETPDL